MAVRVKRRSRELIRCARCGQLVSKENSLPVDNGFVGGACLQSLLSSLRNGEVATVGS